MPRLVTFGDTALRLHPPDRERLETARELRVHADGTESNVAVAAARLGADARWLSKLPDDELGRRVVAELHEHGLRTEVAWADPSAGRQGLVFTERGADPRESTTIQDRTGAAAGTANPSDFPTGLVQGADAFFVGGGTPALSERARKTTEALLRACDGLRAFDLDHEPSVQSAEEAGRTAEELLDAVDVLIASEADARAVLSRSGGPRELVHSIAAERDLDAVIVTRGEHGAVGWEDGVVHEQSAIETETVDPAGQHEAFVGGVLARLLDGAPLDECLAHGAAAAALTRTVPGPTGSLTRGEVDRLVESTAGERRGR